MSVDKGLTNTFSSGIRIWILVKFLVLFHWKLHKNCTSTILPGNITYSKNQTSLQNLHLVWVQRPIWSPCWISLEWSGSCNCQVLCGLSTNCAVEIIALVEDEATHTTASWGSHLLHSNWMTSCKDPHSQGMPDVALLSSWGSCLLSFWIAWSQMWYNSLVSLDCFKDSSKAPPSGGVIEIPLPIWSVNIF